MLNAQRSQQSDTTVHRSRAGALRRTLKPGRRPVTIVIVSLALVCSAASAADSSTASETTPASISYSVGYEFGGRLAKLGRGGTTVELTAVLRGMLDAMSGSEPRLNPDDVQAAQDSPRRAPMASDTYTGGRPPGTELTTRRGGYADDFAALNARRTGVVTLASGVQYEVLKSGGGRHPEPDGKVDVSYQGSLTNGLVFDSTYEDGKPIALRMDQIAVPGLREALLLMKEGDKWRVVIPPAMGFARSGNNQLRKRDLIYEIELVAVTGRSE